jgi:hypothetical protein
MIENGQPGRQRYFIDQSERDEYCWITLAVPGVQEHEERYDGCASGNHTQREG